MYKGDISNNAPKRVLVAEELVFVKKQHIEKKFKFFPVVKTEHQYDKFMLNKLYQFTTNRMVTLELVSFEHDYAELEIMYNELDRAGLNPFRGFAYYKSPQKLVADLPYRPEVIGVLDPENQLMYGHWGIDL
jgi:hypothetical protein